MNDNSLTQNALVQRMFQISAAFVDARALWMFAELGIADVLQGEAKSVAELAKAVLVPEDSVQRVLRVVAGSGIVTEVEPGRFRLTPMGSLLRADDPASMRDWVRWSGGPIFDSFRDALHSIRTGKPVFEKVHGVQMYQYLGEHPEDARVFGGAMLAYSREVSAALMNFQQFRESRRVVDVGGGIGTLALTILRAFPNMRATVFDLPHVAERTKSLPAIQEFADRCDIVGGDFFKSVPDGGDVYMLSAILHNWTNEECVVILRNIRRALPKGRLLLLEMLIPNSDAPHFAKVTDLVMLVALGGRERTQQEYAALLDQGGFRLVRVHSTPYAVQLLEAEPVGP